MKKRGVGLYNWKQIRFETPYTYTVGVVIGVVMILLAVELALGTFELRAMEMKDYGVADLHWGRWATTVGFFLVGIFWSHAGVIYWFRRIFRR